MSTAGASILGVGYVLPLIYLIWSMRYGPVAEANPWPSTGLELANHIAATNKQL